MDKEVAAVCSAAAKLSEVLSENDRLRNNEVLWGAYSQVVAAAFALRDKWGEREGG